MAQIDQSGLAGKCRDKPIGTKLKDLLDRAADAAGVDVVRVTSGSQPGTTGCRTGSTRHDNGRAADLQLVKNGVTQAFSDQTANSIVKAFVTACAANGATGIGAGVGYMGPRTLHVGFGKTPQDTAKLVWGADGASANAPAWLKTAADAGWNAPAAASGVLASAEGERFAVIARGGLFLRKGPGLEFGATKVVDAGTSVTVLAFDGAWARVDLGGDGLVDGHVHSAFLKAIDADDDPDDGIEDVEEP